MGVYKTEGIVLRARAYGEADSILTVFTKEFGKLQLIAKGVRKPKSRKRGSVQPFSYSKFLVYEGKSIDTITQGDIVESFSFLVEDLELLTLGSYCCELIDSFLPERERNDEVFNLIIRTFYYMPFVSDRELMIRAFELQLLKYMGYFPAVSLCVHCQRALLIKSYFSSSHGGTLCDQCRDFDPFSILTDKGILAIMEQLTKLDLKKLKILRVSDENKATLKKITESYIRYLLEKRLKTVDIIKSINIKEP